MLQHVQCVRKFVLGKLKNRLNGVMKEAVIYKTKNLLCQIFVMNISLVFII